MSELWAEIIKTFPALFEMQLTNKDYPVFSGVLRYFPKALLEVSRASLAGNKQHMDGEPLHWDRSKSTDDGDALVRHLLKAGEIDDDGVRHSAKVAWRALAVLEKELEAQAPEEIKKAITGQYEFGITPGAK